MINSAEFTPMLTMRQVALLLNIHSSTVRRWCSQGILNSYRIPRSDRRFRLQDVDRLLTELKEKQESQKQAVLA